MPRIKKEEEEVKEVPIQYNRSASNTQEGRMSTGNEPVPNRRSNGIQILGEVKAVKRIDEVIEVKPKKKIVILDASGPNVQNDSKPLAQTNPLIQSVSKSNATLLSRLGLIDIH